MLTLVQPRCSTLGQARGLAMAHHPWAWLNSWGAPVLLLLLLYHSTFSEPPLPASPQLDTQNLSSRTSLSPRLFWSVPLSLLWVSACSSMSQQFWPSSPPLFSVPTSCSLGLSQPYCQGSAS